jgi:hypothetical protein
MQAYLDKLQVTTNPILSLSLSLSLKLKKKRKERKKAGGKKSSKYCILPLKTEKRSFFMIVKISATSFVQ